MENLTLAPAPGSVIAERCGVRVPAHRLETPTRRDVDLCPTGGAGPVGRYPGPVQTMQTFGPSEAVAFAVAMALLRIVPSDWPHSVFRHGTAGATDDA